MTSGKVFLEFLKSLSTTSDYFDFVMPEKEKYPYDRKVVKELVKSRKTKGITINREDLWK
jgi:3-hydroxy-3-methylglutaryl CoA synthase